jgi:8-oxo-dGTP diphosphatase
LRTARSVQGLVEARPGRTPNENSTAETIELDRVAKAVANRPSEETAQHAVSHLVVVHDRSTLVHVVFLFARLDGPGPRLPNRLDRLVRFSSELDQQARCDEPRTSAPAATVHHDAVAPIELTSHQMADQHPTPLEHRIRYADVLDWRMHPSHAACLYGRAEPLDLQHVELVCFDQCQHGRRSPSMRCVEVNFEIPIPIVAEDARPRLPGAERQTKHTMTTQHLAEADGIALACSRHLQIPNRLLVCGRIHHKLALGSRIMSEEKHCYAFPRPSVTTDVAVFTVDDRQLQILLIERNQAPMGWALPGGFLQVGDRHTELAVAGGGAPPMQKFDFSLEGCARRELREEAGVNVGELHQLGAFGDADRDARGRYVTIAYWAFVHKSQHRPKAGSDAKAVRWCDSTALPALAFDHANIVKHALSAIGSRHLDTEIFLDLMPQQFTYPEFHRTYESATNRTIDRSSLHRRVLPFLRDAVAADAQVDLAVPRSAHRPPTVYEKTRAVSAAITAGKTRS